MKKVALITGCAKGIGREIALDLARDGYDIIGTFNKSIKEIEKLKSRIDSIGVKCEFYKVDLTQEIDINNLYEQIVNKYEKLDLLINNASLSIDDEFDSKTKQDFMKVLEVNLVGPFLMIQKFRELLDLGVIINISSTDGINTYTKLNMDYSASKAGLINLTKSLALELSNIKIYALCPNWVDTESVREMDQQYLKNEMQRVGQFSLIDPKDVSKKVLFIIDSNYKSGSIIVMEG